MRPIRLATTRRIKLCPVGTLVSYRRVDGTCRTVPNFRHAWHRNGTCSNCDMTREEAGYSVTKRELRERERTAERRRKHGSANDEVSG